MSQPTQTRRWGGLALTAAMLAVLGGLVVIAVWTLRWSSSAGAVAVSPDGKLLAAAIRHGENLAEVRVWDIEKQTLEGTLPVNAVDLAFTSDGSTLVTAGRTGAAGFDVNSLTRLWQVSRARAAPFAFLARNGSKLVISGGNNPPSAEIWDLKSGQRTHVITGKVPGNAWPVLVWAAAFSPDGKLLATGRGDGTARVLEVATAQELAVLRVGGAGTVSSVAFSSDGQTLYAAGGDGLVKWWNISTKEYGGAIKLHLPRYHYVDCLALSPDGTTVAIGNGTTLFLWDTATQQQIVPPAEYGGAVDHLAFFPDGESLAVGVRDGSVYLRDLDSGESQVFDSADRTLWWAGLSAAFAVWCIAWVALRRRHSGAASHDVHPVEQCRAKETAIVSQRSPRRRIGIVLGFAMLVVLNIVLVGVPTVWPAFEKVASVALPTAEVALVAAWCGLSTTQPAWRLLGAAVAVAAASLLLRTGFGGPRIHWPFLFTTISVAVAAALLLGRLEGVNLQNLAGMGPHKPRYSLRQMLGIVAILAGLLAVARGVDWEMVESERDLTLIISAGLIACTLVVVWTVLGARRLAWGLLLLVLIALPVSYVVGVAGFKATSSFYGGVAKEAYPRSYSLWLLLHATFLLLPMLVMRSRGYRLSRRSLGRDA